MKRNIITLIIVVFAMMQTTAQTYDNLWKQADIIAQKDHFGRFADAEREADGG